MQKLAILFFGLLFICSCSSDDDDYCPDSDTGLIGTWKLIEIYIDPGDGSGTFRKVESNKTVTFYGDGTLTSNGSLCDVSIETGNPGSGTYSLESASYRSDDCGYPQDWENDFDHSGNVLTLTYLCFEPCVEKYRKVCTSNDQ